LSNIINFIDIWEQHFTLCLVSSSIRKRITGNFHSVKEISPRTLFDTDNLPAGILYFIGCGFGSNSFSFYELVQCVQASSGSRESDRIVYSKINVPIHARIAHSLIWKCEVENEELGFLVPPDNPYRDEGRRASAVMYDDHFGKPEAVAIMDRVNPIRLFTTGENCWFLLDFGKLFVQPRSYALRYHRPVLKRDATPKNWKLEGGNVNDIGEIVWKILKVHENDCLIRDCDGAFAVWDLDYRGKEAFRYFRIIRVSNSQDRARAGVPSSNPSLYISGFEIYGSLNLSVIM
jgi:hypothetical protein